MNARISWSVITVTAVAAVVLISCAERQLTDPPASEFSGFNLQSLPADQPISRELILERRASVQQSFVRAGSDYWNSDGATEIADSELLIEPADGAALAWAVYRFENLLPEDGPQAALIATAALESIGSFYVGIADYAAQRWVWQAVEPGQTISAIPIQPSQNVISPGGNCYIALVAPAGSRCQLSEAVLHVDVNAPPPLGLSASQRTHLDAIELSWLDPADMYDPDAEGPGSFAYDSVRVFRSELEAGPYLQIAEVEAGITEFLDTSEAELAEPVFYKVATVRHGAAGQPGLPASGFVGARPAAVLEVTGDDQSGWQDVTFDMSASYDPDGGSVLTYELELSDGQKFKYELAETPAFTLSLNLWAPYWATLRVTDETGHISLNNEMWVSCLTGSSWPLKDAAGYPDPHETISGESGNWMADLGFNISNAGAPPYFIQLHTDFRGNQEGSFSGWMHVGDTLNGDVTILNVPIPSNQPAGDYFFAIRVATSDAPPVTWEYVWCTPVTLK